MLDSQQYLYRAKFEEAACAIMNNDPALTCSACAHCGEMRLMGRSISQSVRARSSPTLSAHGYVSWT